jgi:hypothetical protein
MAMYFDPKVEMPGGRTVETRRPEFQALTKARTRLGAVDSVEGARLQALTTASLPLSEIFKNSPDETEMVSERAKALRFAERGDYVAFFKNLNEGWAALPAKINIVSERKPMVLA